MTTTPLSAGQPTSVFTPSLIIPPSGLASSLIGWKPPPTPRIDPFLNQPANAHLLHGLDSQPAFSNILTRSAADGWQIPPGITGDTPPMFRLAMPEQRLSSAFRNLSRGDVVGAGQNFRHAREALQLSFVRGQDVEQFIGAAMGEAVWHEGADTTTYRALDHVREWALKNGHADLKLQEKLVRANLVRRLGGSAETALNLLVEISALIDENSWTPVQRHLVIQSLLSQIDIYLQEGVRTSGKDRRRHFESAKRVLGELEEVVISLKEAGADRGEHDPREVDMAAEIHAYMIDVLMRHSYPLDAYNLAQGLVGKYPESDAAKRVLSTGSPVEPFIDEDGRLSRPSPRYNLWNAGSAALREGVSHARFRRGMDFWKVASAGVGIGVIGALVHDGNADFGTMMQIGALGATALAAKFKAYYGLVAPETRQAWETGYSDKGLVVGVAARALELGATYAFFGGMVPGVGYLEGVPVLRHVIASADGNFGQFYGAGSILTGLVSSFIYQGADAAHFMGEYGIDKGWDLYWHNFLTTTHFGSALKAGWDFWERFVTYALVELPQGVLDGAKEIFSDPVSAKQAFRLYKAATLAWAGATMVRPGLRKAFYDRYPRAALAMELGMLPAGYFLGVDVGDMTGVAPIDKEIISAFGMIAQVVVHRMSGGNLRNLDLANTIRNAMVIPLYAGTGAQMKGVLETTPIAENFFLAVSDNFFKSMGIQIGLIPIGFAHGLLLKFPFHRFWQNKAGRSFSAEVVGNVGRLMLGWSSYQGTLFGEGMQQIIQCPWMTRVWQEPAGGSVQRNMFREDNRPVERKEGQTDEKFNGALDKAAKVMLQEAKVAGRRWPFSMPLTGKTFIERIPFFTALPFTLGKKDEPFPTNPEEKYYRMVYRELARTGKKMMPREYVRQYLGNLGLMIMDVTPGLRDVRRNLLVATWAAREGAHGDAIKRFFEERDWLFNHYDISRDIGTPPEGSFGARWKQAAWFRERLQGSK